jgi:outer membrane protein assembly factor BamB
VILVVGLATVLAGTQAPAAAPQTSGAASLQKLDPQSWSEWELALPMGPRGRAAVLEDRVAVLSETGGEIRLLALDGSAIGRVSPKSPLATLVPSPNGRYLLGRADLTEDDHYAVLMTKEGAELWSATLGSTLRFSSSGDFLLASWDAADSSQAPIALRSADGSIAWTDASNPSYWQLSAAADDTAAYYRRDELQLVDLRAGRVLWRRSVEADRRHDLGTVVLSRNGERVAVQYRVALETQPEVVTRVYRADGELEWERRATPVPDVTNGGALKAVSSDGMLVAVDDLDHFAILSGRDGRELSRLQEATVCCIAAFSSDLLALEEDGTTRLLSLGAEGAIGQDVRLEGTLDFSGVAEPIGPQAPFVALLKKRSATGLTLSKVHFDPRRPASGLER